MSKIVLAGLVGLVAFGFAFVAQGIGFTAITPTVAAVSGVVIGLILG